MAVQARFRVQHFRWEHLPHAVDLINLNYVYFGEERRSSEEGLKRELIEPGYNAETDAFVAITPDDKVVGFADIYIHEGTGRAYSRAYVHPDYWRNGIGRQLLRASDARILERAALEVPEHEPLHVNCGENDKNEGATALLLSEGYQIVRYFYTMMTDDLPQQPVALPEGFTMRPFDAERDTYTLYQAQQESFADHWGFSPLSFDLWRYYVIDDSHFDPSLVFLAFDGDELAGLSICRHFSEEFADLGWVGTLGVRRQWRKRGLGEALLRHSFQVFQSRGYKRVGLGVDASSKTNAVALYERAGMHVHNRHASFRKILRGSAEDIKD